MATLSLVVPIAESTEGTQGLSKQVDGSSVLLSAASGPMVVFHKNATLAQTSRSPYLVLDGGSTNASSVVRQPCPEGATLLDLYLCFATTEPVPFPTIRVFGLLPHLTNPNLWTPYALDSTIYPQNDTKDVEDPSYRGWWIPLPSTDEEFLETLGAIGQYAMIGTDGSADVYVSKPRTFRLKGTSSILVLVDTAAGSDPDASCIIGHFRK